MRQATLRRACGKALGALTALTALYAGNAQALCEQVSQTDALGLRTALDNMPAALSDLWVAFHNHHYNTPEIVWGEVGYRSVWADPSSPPDYRQEYVKHVLSTMLTELGVHFEQPERRLVRWDGQLADITDGSSRAFHSNEDYGPIARGARPSKTFVEVRSSAAGPNQTVFPFRTTSRFWGLHTALLIAEEDPEGAYALWERSPQDKPWYTRVPVLSDFFSSKPVSSTVTTFCTLYNNNFPVGTTSFRAAALVHEGWHSRAIQPMTRHVTSDHDQQDWNKCRRSGRNCDIWHAHRKLDFDSGDTFFAGGAPLFVQATRKRPPLSTYQIQSEFLCDLADNGQDWLPINVAMAASTGAETFHDTAGSIGNNPFVNLEYPRYSCGMPTPLYALPAGSRTNECPAPSGSSTGFRCDEVTDCPAMSEDFVRCLSGCCVYSTIR